MRFWRRHPALNHRVLVSLKTDKAVTGVLWARRGGFVVVKQAELLEPKMEPATLDGEVVVDVANIDFIQILAPHAGK